MNLILYIEFDQNLKKLPSGASMKSFKFLNILCNCCFFIFMCISLSSSKIFEYKTQKMKKLQKNEQQILSSKLKYKYLQQCCIYFYFINDHSNCPCAVSGKGFWVHSLLAATIFPSIYGI